MVRLVDAFGSAWIIRGATFIDGIWPCVRGSYHREDELFCEWELGDFRLDTAQEFEVVEGAV